MMDASRWQRLEEIFHAVADLPAGAARDEQLTKLCGADDSLAADVRALLAEDDRLQRAPTPAPHVGLHLGSYLVGPLIARGGMAAVYNGQRADEQFEQRVAIKIMDLRLSDPALVEQFKAERQILAALEHPALTRLLDGGMTPFGEPYLVMEFVPGVRIDEYCDNHALDVAARVRLFKQVCAGVAHAHRNLVLHRDLKPSNILVTPDGHAKVVDFGTAVLLQPDRLATVSRAPLTPAFASPEQLTGAAVGTASDQYSLGLVLYQLVTGVSPFGDRASLMAAVERAIGGVVPAPPHDVVSEAAAAVRGTPLARFRRVLAGDLGTILRKVLSVDPAARYASLEHLVDDLERWLQGEAILGRPPSLVYQVSRAVRRHRIAVAMATALLISLVAATAISIRQAAVARVESAKVRQLNRFLTRVLSSANPSWSNAQAASAATVTVQQVLDGAGALIASELGDRPMIEADLRRTLGRTYNGMGAPAQALPHLERALSLYRDQGDAFGVAFTQDLLGNLRIQQGRFAEAESLLRDAVDYVRGRGSHADPELHQLATSDLANAIAYQRPGDPEAIALMHESIAVADRHGSNDVLASITWANLGGQYTRLGWIDKAEAALEEARRRMEAQPFVPPEHNSTLRSLGTIRMQRGDYPEAERLLRTAAEGAARTRPPDHPLQPNYQIWWGRVLLALGDVERARPIVQRAYARYTEMRPRGHVEMALPLITLGILHRAEGRLDESEHAIREARTILSRYPVIKDRAADAAGELGLTLRAMGRSADADALLRESYDTLRTAFGDQHPLTREARQRMSPDAISPGLEVTPSGGP